MPNLTDELDQLIKMIDGEIQRQPGSGDMLDLILASPQRETRVRSLRHDPVVEAFRQELTDGLIRVDTANKLLSLVNTVVTALLTQ